MPKKTTHAARKGKGPRGKKLPSPAGRGRTKTGTAKEKKSRVVRHEATKLELKVMDKSAAQLIPVKRQDSLIAWCELYMTIEGRASSDDTVDAKRRDLQTFVQFFLSATGADRVDLWTRSITTDYLKHLERQLKRKPATINRHLATLKHVARWIASQRPFLAGNPTDGIADLEPDDPEWRGLTAIQVTRLKAAADQLLHLQRKQSQSPYRNFALFTVLLQTGLRISELLALRLDQYEGKHFTNVKRKGKKRSRKVFLNKPAREALDAFIKEERGKKPGPLFCSKSGLPLRRGNAHEVLKAIQDQANANWPKDEQFTWSAHDLRHTFLRAVANRYGVHYAKELSGHASDRYIWRYVQPSDEEKARAVEELY